MPHLAVKPFWNGRSPRFRPCPGVAFYRALSPPENNKIRGQSAFLGVIPIRICGKSQKSVIPSVIPLRIISFFHVTPNVTPSVTPTSFFNISCTTKNALPHPRKRKNGLHTVQTGVQTVQVPFNQCLTSQTKAPFTPIYEKSGTKPPTIRPTHRKAATTRGNTQ